MFYVAEYIIYVAELFTKVEFIQSSSKNKDWPRSAEVRGGSINVHDLPESCYEYACKITCCETSFGFLDLTHSSNNVFMTSVKTP